MVDYLIATFGFSLEKAIKASNRLSHLKSLQKPESFVYFMKSHGFSDAHIKKIVSCNPKYLGYNVEEMLAPKFQSLKYLGFCGYDLIHLIVSNHKALLLNFDRVVIPRIKFWQGLLGSRDHLIKLFKYNISSFLTNSIDKRVMPNLSFLRSCGISDERITMVVRQSPKFILQTPKALIAAADRVETEMGISHSSGMFVWALFGFCSVSKAGFHAKRKLMTSFGWSEADFLSAFRKAPIFLRISCRTLADKMDFLLKEAGCEPSDIAHNATLLTYSLEKRLIPRCQVMKILRSRGLISRERKLLSIMISSERAFTERYVFPHKEKIPELEKIFPVSSVWKEKEAD